MYKEDFERQNFADRNSEDIFSKPVRAGKRTYFFDVKTTKADGSFSFDKHKIFLYKEDFDKFQEGLAEVIAYMRENLIKEDKFTDVDFEEL